VTVGRERREALPSPRDDRVFLLDIKQSGCEANHSFPSSAKKENEATLPVIIYLHATVHI